MSRISAFFAFWYDFVIGDDWRVAAGVVAALAATVGLSAAMVPAWWVVPAAVLVLLPASLLPAARRVRAQASPSRPPDDSGSVPRP